MAGRLVLLLALLDEAAVILLVVGGAAYLAGRLGLLSPVEAAVMVSPVAIFLAVAAAKAVEAMARRPRVGVDALAGSRGRVVEVREGGRLLVEVEGELWRGTLLRGSVKPGDTVVVRGARGLVLLVEPEEG
ncbi:NfeD family protein [Aeropyrum camini]|uniref:Membrane protein n=1 Tax=Aeropyrum camini SY1 = JCM 12091 TaxID=1198449 RepID=U3TFY5_9CREN|nr:NfeD family protein [Aeropyrum camini]BAN90950.1 membrane protein [Aeropyrum camini SY1 = JCM 12091]